MRLQVLSDLHVDVVGGFTPQLAPGADVVVCPGDVCEGVLGAMRILRAAFPAPTPIVMTLGNHEFYGRGVQEERALAAEAAEKLGITLLDDARAVIGGVRFVGATLWTDFRLGHPELAPVYMAIARERMNDYRRICLVKKPWRRFTPEASAEIHRVSRAFLEAALAEPFEGPTVVVTHHAPHQGSIHRRHERTPVNPAYVSDLGSMIERHRPALWLHGHVHDSFDYQVGETRVLSNPRGYGDENAAFDPALVIEVGTAAPGSVPCANSANAGE